MSDDVLVLLGGIRDDVSQIMRDLAEVKVILGLLEAGDASVSRRVDRIGSDVERISIASNVLAPGMSRE